MTTPTADVLNDRYRLLDVVGEGGMAVVWRAEDLLLGRAVAVKILRSQYAADADFLERFRSEARAAAALNDPGIVAVHDVGQDGDRHYLVMEFVPGQNLKDVIRADAPLAPQRAVRIAAQLSHAVGHAHDMGLVHRDVKPQNVLLAPDGRMKMADFGIARAVSAIGTTAPGVVLGTVHYIAPEQAAGDAASPASDVYSLGVVLYEMLAGQVPFEADSSVGVAMKVMHEDPEPVDRLNPRVPSVLVGIVSRAMARDPADRYPDARGLAEALDGFARWSEQATGGFEVPAPSPDDAPTRAARRPGVARRPAPPRPRLAGPTLDRTGLLLGLLALIALLGLIPLWRAVLRRVEVPDGLPRSVATQDVGALPVPPTQVVARAPAATARVPDVTGRDAAEAQATLEAIGFSVTLDYDDRAAGAEGEVLRSAPSPGESATTGDAVRLVVAGPRRVEVPFGLEGTDFQATIDQLIMAGLQPVRQEQWGGEDAAGFESVLGVHPPPGSRVPAGTEIRVSVNSGRWLPVGATFQDSIHLRGVDLASAAYEPGETITFVPQWEAVDVVAGEYVGFAMVEGEGGIAALDVHGPAAGRPTSSWQANEIVFGDAFALPLDPGLEPGIYGLWLGLAEAGGDPTDASARLAVMSFGLARARGGGDRVYLTELAIGTPDDEASEE